MKKIFLLLIFFFNLTFAQVENSSGIDLSLIGTPVFYYDILNFKTEDYSLTKVEVFVHVPFSVMQFIKSSGKFSAEYNVFAGIYEKEKGSLIVEKNWIEKVETGDYNQTNFVTNFNLSLRSFFLKPGNYFIKLEVEDRDSRKKYSIENPFFVKDFSEGISLSDIVIVQKKEIIDGQQRIVPNIPRNVYFQKGGIPILFEIYSNASIKAEINYSIVTKKGDVIFDKTEMVELNQGRNPIEYTFSDLNLSIGDYQLIVKLKTSGSSSDVTSKKSFTSKVFGIPESIKEINKAIEQMIYIANSKEINYIKSAPDEETKLARFLEYWQKQDRNPNTVENEVFIEYYRRVQYANQHFAHYFEGWKTDMGMIYIILGAPSNVQRHPFEYNSKPYEVWEYYEINRQFVFVDNTGFGDYRLITPLYGDMIRFR